MTRLALSGFRFGGDLIQTTIAATEFLGKNYKLSLSFFPSMAQWLAWRLATREVPDSDPGKGRMINAD